MKVFVIIVTYQGIKWYDRCFSSLRNSTLPIKTIVVDNSPKNDTVDYIKQNYPEIHLIKSETNLGFGKGNNLGLRYALEQGCDYVFLLNQDTWLLDCNVIEELIKVHLNNPDFGLLSPMHLRANLKELGMLWEDGNNHCSKKLLSDLYCHSVKEIYETNYVNAAAWLLPRKTIETVGGFDPIFNHYEEDDDYLNRVRYHGFKIGLCPSVRIVHDHQPSKNPFNNNARYHHEQRLLVRFIDLNSPFKSHRYYRYYFRKFIISVLRMDGASAKDYLADIVFLTKNKHNILSSRQRNAQNSATWLEL